jgi:hypothetical protein
MQLDNSALSVDQSVDRVLGWWEARRPFVAAGPSGPPPLDG